MGKKRRDEDETELTEEETTGTDNKQPNTTRAYIDEKNNNETRPTTYH
jgi:hypothetical protein